MAFGRGRQDRESGEDTLPAGAAGEEGGALTAFIDQGSSFEGKLSFKDTVRIDGRFSGEISSDNTLIVGETGEIEAQIRSKTVIVGGSVLGDIHAMRKLVLRKTARVEGNVETACLVVEEGAVLNGALKMADGSGAKGQRGLKAVEGGAQGESRPADPPSPR